MAPSARRLALTSVEAISAASSATTPPAQRKLCSIVHHSNWLALYDACCAADAARAPEAAGGYVGIDATRASRQDNRMDCVSSRDGSNVHKTSFFRAHNSFVVQFYLL